MISDLSCGCYGFVSIPIYDSYGPADCELIVNHSDSTCIVVAKEHFRFINDIRPRCPNLRFIVLMDDRPEDKEWARDHRAEFTHTFSEIEQLGAANARPDAPVRLEDVFTIVYTSGTTGSPKGAVLTHRNITAGAAALGDRLYRFDTQSSHIGYLPLAHIFEHVVEHLMLSRGTCIGYYQGDVTKLMDDIGVLRPTMMPGVPRIFNKLYAGVRTNIQKSGFIKRMIFNLAYRSKNKCVDKGEATPRADKLVFSKIQAKLGGRVRFIFSGSAPLSAEVARFLRVCLGCPLVEGYALTETSSAGAVTVPENTVYGDVGLPLPGLEFKLVDLSEMGYLTRDNPPRGEIWIRGPTVFQGYYKDPGLTRDVLVDGFFRTGDVGMWLPGNRIKIIDRVKNIFKLAQGEFVCAERLEGTYASGEFPMVAQIMIHGDRTMSGLVAVVIPNFETLGQWAKDHGLQAISEDKPALCAHPAVKQFLLEGLNAIGTKANLRRFEHLLDIVVGNVEFSVENKQITPSFKLRRNEVRKVYGDQLTAICDRFRSQKPKE